ncbi:hypothetical protein SAMN05660710_03244 [Paracoccus tibetensis]|uniref:Uncharacterized protein n=2 Tax=Paracoccus tibetensis TaxID=336292 RepID=A0A1G5JIM0_9RHOB|nr:hypothetical protein SAMN05660710_03244 [Paracoccus tibetensis]
MADEDAQAYLRERVESYLTGELNDRERPPLYSEMEPIDGFSPTELLDLWREDPGTLPTDANGSTWWGLWCWDDFVDDVTGVARALEMHVAPEDRWSSAIGKTERSALRRRFGYGMPDLSRALASASTDLALVSQAYIQPFDRPEISRRDAMRRVGPVTFGSAHYYDLPWPTRTLETLENCLVELKVTLSYFVEPYPLKGAMLDPARYRSFGLRFDLKRPRETNAEFQRRRNAEMGARIQAAEDDPNWAFGPKSIAAGSIHCDTWSGTAVELASRDQLAIYPVMGWWRDRPGQGRYLDKARYALVVTLTAPEAGIDLQAEVEIAARTRIAAQAQIAINMPRTGE